MAQRQMSGTPRGGRAGRNTSASNRTNRTSYRDSGYVYGNVAVDVSIQRQLEEPSRRLSNETRKNREKARHMSLGYMAFLMVALCTCAVVLINYVQLQADLTTKTQIIAARESELNKLTLKNDEDYNRITRSIDLEEIKRIAITELGMTYAEEGQIIIYDNAGTDYMRSATNTN